MSKAVLRSIKPYWFYLTCEGIKTVEVGKTIPKDSDWNNEVFLYCTKDKQSFNKIPKEFQEKYRKYLGRVGARFLCDEIIFFGNVSTDSWKCLCGNTHEYHKKVITNNACLTEEQLHEYGGKYGWHISNLKFYDKPKELEEFFLACNKPSGLDCYVCIARRENSCKTIKKPPQSWCYIER